MQAEIEEGAWFVVPSEPGDVFTTEPDGLWNRVLRRQRGELAMFASYPRDARAN